MQKLILLSVLIISGAILGTTMIMTPLALVQATTNQSVPFNVLQHLVISLLAKQQQINRVPFNVLQHLVISLLAKQQQINRVPFNVLQHLVISLLAKQQQINRVPFNVLQHLVTIILLHHYRHHQN